MKNWTLKTEIDDENRKQKEQQRKEKIKATQSFQVQQMYSNPHAVQNASDVKLKRKFELGGVMNPEEAKMNRALLQEIAKAKREGGSIRDVTSA